MFGEDPAATAAHYERAERRKRARELVDGATPGGRGIDGVVYWRLVGSVETLVEQLDQLDRTAALPSGDALDRASRMIYDHAPSLPPKTDVSGAFVPQYQPLIEEVAKLIDAADAAADKEQIGGHTVTHWHNTAERRARQINELDGVVRRRNDRIAELERELEVIRRNGGANLLRAIDRTVVLEAELRIAERKLEIADRQRREFLGHSRTANARRAEVERERDAARRRIAELESAGWGEVAEQAEARVRAAERRMFENVSSGDLLAEIGRRVDSPSTTKENG